MASPCKLFVQACDRQARPICSFAIVSPNVPSSPIHLRAPSELWAAPASYGSSPSLYASPIVPSAATSSTAPGPASYVAFHESACTCSNLDAATITLLSVVAVSSPHAYAWCPSTQRVPSLRTPGRDRSSRRGRSSCARVRPTLENGQQPALLRARAAVPASPRGLSAGPGRAAGQAATAPARAPAPDECAAGCFAECSGAGPSGRVSDANGGPRPPSRPAARPGAGDVWRTLCARAGCCVSACGRRASLGVAERLAARDGQSTARDAAAATRHGPQLAVPRLAV